MSYRIEDTRRIKNARLHCLSSRAYPSVWPLLAVRGKPARRQVRLKAGRESGSKHGVGPGEV